MMIKLSKLPIFRGKQWSDPSPSPLIGAIRNFAWLLRLFSLASWLSPFFQKKASGSFYTHENFADYYLILSLLFTISVLIGTTLPYVNSYFASIWAAITLADALQYQLRLVLLRPIFHKNYSPYSAERTLAILLTLYIQTIGCFSLLYLHAVPDDFSYELGVVQAIEFSIVTITTVGYGNVTAEPGSIGAIVAAMEALSGVLFLGLIISTAIGRTKKLVPLDSAPNRVPLQDVCLQLLSSYGYTAALRELAKAISGDLWIVGGWVRNSALMLDYCGDIDCLTTLPPSELDKRLKDSGYQYEANRFATRRLLLPDGNHIDLTSTFEQASTADIVKALNNFNFSVNSAAINFSSSRLVYSKDFAADVRNRAFRVTCDKSLRSGQYLVGFLRDLEVLEQYYGLSPIKDQLYQELDESRQRLLGRYHQISFTDAMVEASSRAASVLPPQSRAWIVRGCVRSAFFGELRYWDDIDVIAETSKASLIDHLNELNLSWTLNYFGNPKIFHPSGVTIDAWVLERGQSVEEAILCFPHNVDAAAWPVYGDALIADESIRNALDNRQLIINLDAISSLRKQDISYAAIKAIYLILRHSLEIDSTVTRLLHCDFEATPTLRKHAINLVKELHICGVKEMFDTAEYIRKIVGENEPTSLMLKYWESPLRGVEF